MFKIIKYIPLQQGLRLIQPIGGIYHVIIKYIPLQQGLRLIITQLSSNTEDH